MLPDPSVGVTVNAVSLHVAGVCGVTNGFGSTVTETLKAVPTQLPEVGVTEYVTPIAELVELTKVPDVNNVAALPIDIPERPVTVGALHV